MKLNFILPSGIHKSYCYDQLLWVNKYITQHRDMRCHTNVSKSLRRVSLVQRTRRQARCLLQLLLFLRILHRRHKALSFWGRGRERSFFSISSKDT